MTHSLKFLTLCARLCDNILKAIEIVLLVTCLAQSVLPLVELAARHVRLATVQLKHLPLRWRPNPT